MGWRVVVVETPCKLAYKNNHMLLRSEKDTLVFIPEIDVIIVATTQVVFTGVLLSELIKNKVKIIFCDEKHNPACEMVSYNGTFNCSRKIYLQTKWDDNVKSKVFTKIIEQKIKNQSSLLRRIGKEEESNLLTQYLEELQQDDITNREGFAAKVYFNALFGKEFIRDGVDVRNSALNYGYTVLLSYINREVVKNGYLTQLGIHHFNEFNYFNLSCDLIEPFRVLIDEFVFNNPMQEKLTPEYKHGIVKLLSKRVKIDKEYYLTDVIEQIIRNNLKCLTENAVDDLVLYEY